MYVSYDPVSNRIIATETPPPIEDGVCDFCHYPTVSHICPADDVEMVPGHMMIGAWAACEICAGHVSSGDRQALARRGVRALKQFGAHPLQASAAVGLSHRAYWSARTSAPYAVNNEGAAEAV